MGDEMGDVQKAERSPRAPAKALTARAVDAAKEPGKYFDGNGLYLRVDKSGLRRIRSARTSSAAGSWCTVPADRDLAPESPAGWPSFQR